MNARSEEETGWGGVEGHVPNVKPARLLVESSREEAEDPREREADIEASVSDSSDEGVRREEVDEVGEEIGSMGTCAALSARRAGDAWSLGKAAWVVQRRTR